MDEILAQFLIEGRELVAQAEGDLAALAARPDDRARLDSLFRAAHTLKGSVALFDMAPAGRVLHTAEDLLEAARKDGRLPAETGSEALTAMLDQTDRWIDAMETDGALGSDASDIADALVARLRGEGGASPTIAGALPEWLTTLIQRRQAAVDAAGTDLVAFRYTPDAECFFRGDDPLAVAAGVPELIALDILPIAPWPTLADFEPYHSAVTIEGLSAAADAEIRAAFRFVADEAEILAVPIRQSEAIGDAAGSTLQSLRIAVSRIDALANGVGELIVAGNAFAHVAAAADKADPRIGAEIRAAHAGLDRAIGAMRGAVMAVRSVPLGPSLRRLPRMARALSQQLGKRVDFEIAGETTEVDKAIADAIFEPLLHLVRNAIDHGIEDESARITAGKSPVGHIRLEIRPDGEQVAITLNDDGAGMDPVRLRELAVARGLLDHDGADALDDDQALRLIFAAGFSTAREVTTLSGRGVGMDAVRLAVEQLGGRIDVSSAPGKGTSIGLRLPLNSILTRLLIVRVGQDRYGVPLDRIAETASVATDTIMALGAGRACVLRERTLPVLSLAALLGGVDAPGPIAKLIVTDVDGEPVGLIVDGFGERIDGLVRARSGIMSGVPGIAGTMLLGDGGVLIILDLAELAA